MEPGVIGKHVQMRILAFAAADMQETIRRRLAPIDADVVFINRSTDVSHLIHTRESYDVALLPASLPDTAWWVLWGEISLLNPRPAILVYTTAATFQLWSGVLEAGGYDVIVEPFTDEELQGAVLRAARSFELRSISEKRD